MLMEWHLECQRDVLPSCNLLLGTKLNLNIDSNVLCLDKPRWTH